MAFSGNSLMVILDRDEYCFLYERESFPELLESLLEYDDSSEEPTGGLNGDQAREIARGLIGHIYQTI